MSPNNGSNDEQPAETKPSTSNSTANPGSSSAAGSSSTSSILKERRFKLSRFVLPSLILTAACVFTVVSPMPL